MMVTWVMKSSPTSSWRCSTKTSRRTILRPSRSSLCLSATTMIHTRLRKESRLRPLRPSRKSWSRSLRWRSAGRFCATLATTMICASCRAFGTMTPFRKMCSSVLVHLSSRKIASRSWPLFSSRIRHRGLALLICQPSTRYSRRLSRVSARGIS